MFWQALIKIIEIKDNLDIVLSILIKEICKILKTDACSIFTLEDQTNIYTLSASTLVPSIKSGMIYIDAQEDFIGTVALREEPIIISNVEDSNQYTVLRTLSRKKFHSLLAAPIIYKSKVIAILALQIQKKK